MGTETKMNDYYHFKESTDVSLCDCVVNRITGLPDELIIHIPKGLVSIKGDAPKYTSALSAHVVGCGIDSVLIYIAKTWSVFGKKMRTVTLVDFAELEHMFDSGCTIKISDEYFAFERLYIKGSLVKQDGTHTSKELFFLLNDVDHVDFSSDIRQVSGTGDGFSRPKR